MYSCAISVWLRASLARASSRVARALASAASSWRTWASSSAGSSSSRTWPALTRSLKSTFSFFTVPETCVPTLTSTTGLSVPLAETVCVTSPVFTAASRYLTCAELRFCSHAMPPPASTRSTSAARKYRLRIRLRRVMGIPARAGHGCRSGEAAVAESSCPSAWASVARSTYQPYCAWMFCNRALASDDWAVSVSRIVPTPAL